VRLDDAKSVVVKESGGPHVATEEIITLPLEARTRVRSMKGISGTVSAKNSSERPWV
jgi:hypothetical protein